MELLTKIPIEKPSARLIDYNSTILLLGSCFVENIGQKLEYFKFRNLQNPFGILFNSVVIERLVTAALDKKVYSEKDVFFHNERWHCYDAHSSLSSSSSEELIKRLNQGIEAANKQLVNATHIVITLGTAWIYRHKESNRVVANCHKVPQKELKKELLGINDIYSDLDSMKSRIRKINQKANIIFTVSPVRHLKDGFIENQQSKAHLISAINEILSSQVETKNLWYFPAYEIMMDELRDYRFYAEDMIHPNATAINYIWNKFNRTWISDESQTTMREVDEVQKGLLHRPFEPQSEAHRKFLAKLVEKKESLQSKFSYIKF